MKLEEYKCFNYIESTIHIPKNMREMEFQNKMISINNDEKFNEFLEELKLYHMGIGKISEKRMYEIVKELELKDEITGATNEVSEEAEEAVEEEKVEKASENNNMLLYVGALGALLLGAALFFLRKKK